MSVHPHEGDLHRHYDGELSARESWEIEGHLRECHACAAAFDEIHTIVGRLGELPDSVEPPVDLWQGIAARIGAEDELMRRRRGRQSRIRKTVFVGWLSAVAAALVLGVGLGRLFPGGDPPLATGADTDATASGSMASAALLASYEEPAYDQAVAELETILEGMRDQLEPETIAVVEENLTIIDQAIAESQAALLEDPINEQLHDRLSKTRQMKLKTLRMVTGALAS